MFGQRTATKKQLKSTKKSLPKIIKFVPHEYQNKCINFLVRNLGGGLLLSPGLGKTSCVLEAIKKLRAKKKVKRVLVVAKLRICYQVWPKEIRKWGYDFSYEILHGKKDVFESSADVDIINYDSLSKFCDKKVKKFHGKRSVTYTVKKEFVGRYDAIVFDESSKLKNTGSQRFKMVKKLIKFTDIRIILTGSPMPNNLLELFGQVYVIDLGKTLGEYITQFKNQYFYPSGYGGFTYKPVEGAEDTIFKKIKPLVIRFGDDELDLPPITFVDRVVTLPEEVMSVYNEMKDDFIANVEAGLIVATNGAVAAGKLRQIASGGLYLKSWDSRKEKSERMSVHLHDEKTEECIEIVEELQGSPCIIAYEWNHDLERLLKAFPDARYINGSTPPKMGVEIEDEWNAGNIPILLGNVSALAHGLNLQESGYTLLIYSLTYSWEDYDQLMRRLWRQGQKNKVRVIHILAEGTIDYMVLESLKTKKLNQDSFLEAMEDGMHIKFKRKREVLKLKKLSVKERKEIIIRHFPNPSREVCEEDVTGNQFLTCIVSCIAGWMPQQHKEFLESCGVRTRESELLESLMKKTRVALFEVLGVNAEDMDIITFKDDNLINDIINYYVEVNEAMDNKTKSKFGKGGSTKKAAPKKKGTVKKAPPKKKGVAKELPPKKKAAPKKKVAVTKKKAAPKKKESSGKATASIDAKKTIIPGTNEKKPVIEVRQEIQEMVPAGKRGIQAGKLVSKVVEECEISEKRAVGHVLGMIKKGFLQYK